MRVRATDTPCLPCLSLDTALEISRNDILRRDLVDVTYKPNTKDCVVSAGTLHDVYMDATIEFTRGQNTSTAVQIDHVLSAALSRSPSLFAGHIVDGMPLMGVVAV